MKLSRRNPSPSFSNRSRSGSHESQRRRHCSRPSARLHRRKTHGYGYSRTAAAQRALRHGHHVHRRRHGGCRHPRTSRVKFVMRNHLADVIPPALRAAEGSPVAALARGKRAQGLSPTAARNLLFNHRHIALPAIALVAALSLNAQAQEPVPLARGNTSGEPHHHLKIENEYVRVYYVEVPPHENTQLHQHDHDYIYVSLGPSDVVNAIVDKPEIHLQLKDGETHFTRGGFAHVARNLADTPFHNITIELLKPQGEPKNVCAQVLLGAPL